MAMMEMPEAANDDLHLSTPPCCENQYVSIQVDEIFKKEIAQELAPVLVMAAIASILYLVEFDCRGDQPIGANTSPPFLKQDFQVLHQVFLV